MISISTRMVWLKCFRLPSLTVSGYLILLPPTLLSVRERLTPRSSLTDNNVGGNNIRYPLTVRLGSLKHFSQTIRVEIEIMIAEGRYIIAHFPHEPQFSRFC